MRDKLVVQIGRLGQAEQQLEEALDRRRGAEVGAAHHEGHAGSGVIDHATQMIGCRRVLAGEDRVADLVGACSEFASVGLVP